MALKSKMRLSTKVLAGPFDSKSSFRQSDYPGVLAVQSKEKAAKSGFYGKGGTLESNFT